MVDTDNISKCIVGEIALPTRNALVGGPFGSDLVSADYVPAGVPVIRGQNLSVGKYVGGEFVFVSEEKATKLSANLARPGDLVFTQRGNAVLHGGQVAIVPDGPFDRYLVSQSQMKLSPDPAKVDLQFLYFIFSSDDYRHYLRNNAIVTGVPHINLGLLRNYKLSLPSLSEQRAIAHILGTLDDKIELNRRMNATLEAMAQALFKSWFVDFDPVKAKAFGGEPEGMDAETAAFFPNEFRESELGAIPKGWVIRTVDQLADLNKRVLRNSDLFDKIEYIEISAVNKGNIAEIVEYNRGSEPSRARRKLNHGDTVLSTVRPNRGSFFLCLHPSERLIASTGFAVVSPRGENWAFLHSALTRNEIFETLGNLADGGAYPAIRPEVIGNFELIVPEDEKLIHSFHKTTAPLYERADANRIESRYLGQLRDTLLPKLISGQLRIPAAEARTEAAF